jgi:hypothetical protein
MKVYRGVEVQLHALIILAVNEGEQSASHYGHSASGKMPPEAI